MADIEDEDMLREEEEGEKRVRFNEKQIEKEEILYNVTEMADTLFSRLSFNEGEIPDSQNKEEQKRQCSNLLNDWKIKFDNVSFVSYIFI